MCTFNGVEFIDKQLATITAQDLAPAEVVVCDDRSTDGTWEAVSAFAHRSSIPFRLHRNPSRLGSIHNFEQAIAMCSGDLIFLADQDDVWHPEKTDRIEEVFAKRSEVGLVFSDARLVDALGAPIGPTAWQTSQVSLDHETIQQFRDGFAFDRLFSWNAVTGATMAFRSDLVPLVLPFPDLLHRADPPFQIHDGWIALLVSAVREIEPIEDCLIDYRLHDAQQMGLSIGEPPVIRDPLEGRLVEITRRAEELAVVVDRLHRHARRWTPRPALLEALDDELAHLRSRLGLPRRRMARARHVYGEWRTGRYSRYASGAASAITDLFPAMRTYRWRRR